MVVTVKERPFRSEDYSLKLYPVWSCEETGPGQLECPKQIAIDDTTHNILVADSVANTIQVFDDIGKYQYKIHVPSVQSPNGLALTNEFTFVSAQEQLVKFR